MIVSNPPYVAQDHAATLTREIREHEPHTALFGGPSGIEMYERLIQKAGELLRSGGVLVLELGYNSAQHVRAILAAQRHWVNVNVTNDLAGIPRVLAAGASLRQRLQLAGCAAGTSDPQKLRGIEQQNLGPHRIL